MSATAALVPGWTEQNPSPASFSLNTSGASATTNLAFVDSTNTWWPSQYWWYVPYYACPSVPNRIHLTSKEVDRLRAAAKRDAKLKAVLEKFTPVIEVEVEF